MLDEFVEEQNIATKILMNQIKKNNLNHAYIFETNGYSKAGEFVLAFVKYLLCPNKNDKEKCKNCYQCDNINKNIFSEVKHIYPDGMWIKKDQLNDLKKEFSETSIQTKKRIYIIHNAEKLNSVASNSILKFLEEPEENIIAILITNNSHQLLETILSRCQIIGLKKETTNNFKNLDEQLENYLEIPNEISKLEHELKLEKINKAIDFILFYEENKINTVLYTQNKFHQHFKTKEEVIYFLDIANLFYLETLKIKSHQKIKLFKEKEKKLIWISEQNNFKQLSQKIKIIMKLKNDIKLNANILLLVDKMIIEMEGGL